MNVDGASISRGVQVQDPFVREPADDAYALKVTIEGDAALLTVTGDFDLAAHGHFCACAEAMLPMVTALVVDLSGVGFMDSSGLHALLSLQAHALAAGVGELRLRSLSPQVVRLLKVAGMLDTFVIE
ncbi:MAG: Anti-sigma factor antagonist [Acidimicrobiia bacterium]|nr:Anti-sigma factor antagonist [Acidimicrobiia bacterium]